MTDKELTDVLRANSFEAFKLRLADGRSYLVEHPDFCLRTEDNSTLYVSFPGENRTERINREHVLSITSPVLRKSRPKKKTG